MQELNVATVDVVAEKTIMFTTFHALWHPVPSEWRNSKRNIPKDYNFKIPA